MLGVVYAQSKSQPSFKKSLNVGDVLMTRDFLDPYPIMNVW